MRGKLPAVAVVAMLVLTAFASVPVAAAESVSVQTDAPTDVTTSTATLEGNVTALEDAENVTVWFQYWQAGDPSTKTTTAKLTKVGTGTFSIDVTGLESGTEYVVVAHAETESGNATAVGSEVAFTTEAEEAVAVETGSAADVTDSSATLGGELTELAGVANATVWFEYWVQGDPANSSTTANQTLEEAGTFTAAVTGLESGTTYVFVAHAETETLADAGEEATFTTLDRDAPLGVETQSATDVGNESATLNGQLSGMDGEAEAEVWFEYWVQGDPANSSTTTNQTLTAPGSFSAGIGGLENDTTYVYVAHAEANGSAVTGDQVTFTTTDGTEDLANETWDGEGPFGQWLTGVLKNLVPADGQPLGQLVSDIVTANNPGSEHRSDKANPGGNGPPEHAKNGGNNGNGPPEHAKNGSDDEDDEEEDD